MNQSENWPNAPLVFVLAVIRISAYPNFEKRFGTVHENLLESFPERHVFEGLSIEVGASEPSVTQQKSFRIISSSAGVSVLFREDVIAIEWAEYADFSEAEKVIGVVLDAAFTSLPHLIVQHVGLRYVNAILESNGDDLEDFVHPGLLGSPIEGKLIGSTCGSAAELEGGQRVSITLHRSVKGANELTFPPGIEFPAQLKPNRRLGLYLNHAGGFGLLDADGGVSVRSQKEDKNVVVTAFAELRDSMRPMFRSAVTPDAVGRWKEAT